MNPKAFALIIVVVVAVLAALFLLAYVSIRRVAGVRKRDMKLMRETLLRIEDAADQYRDMDSVLAAEIRSIIRGTRKEREGIE